MDKKTFQKKWYCRLLQVMFLGFFIFFIIIGMLGVFYEDDMPFVGFIFAGILAVVYWVAMRNKGSMCGFVFGIMIGLLLLFIIYKFNPEEDIVGIVIITLLTSGLVFAFAGYLIQKYLGKEQGKK
ncbi:MAG: hypothetical protein WC548_00760 [Candidatus Pacearchaeota archaeon]